MWYLVDAAKCDALECEGAVTATTATTGSTPRMDHRVDPPQSESRRTESMRHLVPSVFLANETFAAFGHDFSPILCVQATGGPPAHKGAVGPALHKICRQDCPW